MDNWQPIGVTVEVAIEVSSIGRTMLYQLMNEGKIASKKVGKKRIVNYASLRAFLTSQEQE